MTNLKGPRQQEALLHRRQTIYYSFSTCSPCFNPSCSAITVSQEIFRLDADTLVGLRIQHALLSNSITDSLIQAADSFVPSINCAW